ncbi:MAG: hypothetical protein JNK87_19955 [Bryobacterales bacterium]|nr:hypothetical protein [Bryobacterales bacterium]
MATVVYLLGALVTLACAILLSRGYERSRKRLLLWSSLCFAGLTLSNFLVFADLVLFPGVDLYPARLGTALVAMSLLLFGLIWER